MFLCNGNAAFRAKGMGFDLAAHFLYSIVVFVDHVGGIAQLVERLVRKKFGQAWTQKVLCGQAGQIPTIDISLS
jgi:hypothetical protein